ncbi:MAG: serine hydrolase [bacterium]|nr:serine hydrolase [bacterium]
MPVYNPKKQKPRRNKRFLLLILLIFAGLTTWFYLNNRSENSPTTPQTDARQADEPTEPEAPAYSTINLQPTIDNWVNKQAATYSIVVHDLQADKIIGKNLPDKSYFAASLYKLYVAYLALQDIQNGNMNPNEILSQGFTRKQCIDKMIRESYSPCGEAMMADIGQKTLETRVNTIGITNTTFAGISTTAEDSVMILRLINSKKHLNDVNAAFLLDSMRTQEVKYKRGLQAGAPKATWETKVGWNETYNYHDVGLMTLPDGRKFAVAILSQGNGFSAPIADFSKTIYAVLTR